MKKEVTPVIKKTRTKEEEYEVCPHCMKEIGEKESFIDPDNYVYHSPCYEKGPIDKITPLSPEELSKVLGWGGFEEQDEAAEKALRYERSRSSTADDVKNSL